MWMENHKKSTEMFAEEDTKLESEEEIEMPKDTEFHSLLANSEHAWTLRHVL